jgi:hypothetical protein
MHDVDVSLLLGGQFIALIIKIATEITGLEFTFETSLEFTFKVMTKTSFVTLSKHLGNCHARN